MTIEIFEFITLLYGLKYGWIRCWLMELSILYTQICKYWENWFVGDRMWVQIAVWYMRVHLCTGYFLSSGNLKFILFLFLLNATVRNFHRCSTYLRNLFVAISNAELCNNMACYTEDEKVFIQNPFHFRRFLCCCWGTISSRVFCSYCSWTVLRNKKCLINVRRDVNARHLFMRKMTVKHGRQLQETPR